jgi:hypothetical protein
MNHAVNHPELIISLSRDKVRLQLLEMPGSGRAPWESTYEVTGVFLEDQISYALDTALMQNPFLLEHFDRVEVLVLDQPNICLPKHYVTNGQFSEIARRYLRERAGDTLIADAGTRDSVIAYSIPTSTLTMLREYYSNAVHLHMTSVLWTSIQNLDQILSTDTSRLFIFPIGNTLILLGESSGKLCFSKTFYIQDQTDLLYYAMACSRMLRVKENWHITLINEVSLFEMPKAPHFTIHHHLELPPLHALIASHRLCES